MNQANRPHDFILRTMRKNADQLQDELLVLQCLGGDAEALGKLVTRWQPRFWRHAYCLVGDRGAADDVVQEAWMAIVRGISRLDNAEAFAGWAYRIVANKCVDWVRHRGQERKLSEDLSRANAAGGPGPAEVSDLAERVGAALGRLPADQRALLCLHHVEGFDVGRIAEILGVPEGTVKSRLYHARQELRRLVERNAHE